MAHDQVANWVRGLVGDPGPHNRMAGKSVLELGSFDVNGSIRGQFGAASRYVGVDWRAGPCVDKVSLFHEMTWKEEFDVLVSLNTLEHDPYWELSIAAGIAALKVGGEIIISAAGPGYPPHELVCAPTESYYNNIAPSQLFEALVANNAAGSMIVFTDPPDIAFNGHKRSPPPAG